ncbi:MAG: D-alanyl-D-alanine carboxypeptidase/D-alanyl-D-alanine endopeptidase [Desulfomonilaceae bacterium]
MLTKRLVLGDSLPANCRGGDELRASDSFLAPLRTGLILLALFSALLDCRLARGAEAPLNAQLHAAVQRELPPGCALSIQAVDVGTGGILMEHAADTALCPASTMKIITTASALAFFKPDYTFATEVFVKGASAGRVRTLYLRGGGDPRLVSEQLFLLAKEVVDSGLEEVTGDIVVDDSYYKPSPPLDEADKLGLRSYHAPYGALSLNFNSIKVMIYPGPRVGAPARVVLDPWSDYAELRANVTTVAGDKPAHANISKQAKQGGEIIKVNGEIGVDAPPKKRYVNVAHPALYAGEVFKQYLIQAGVPVRGRVVKGQTADEARLLVSFPSQPLAMNVYWLNKFSNNFMAEQIAMGLGAAMFGPPGTREKGLAALKRHLIACGVPEGHFQLAEASGLSRSNKVSASAFVKVLLAAYRDFSYGYEFVSSLSISGTDGTLKEKFVGSGLERLIRAKTGTLKGVNALAGYWRWGDGRIAAFAILVNTPQPNAGIVDYADRIARAVFSAPLRSP